MTEMQTIVLRLVETHCQYDVGHLTSFFAGLVARQPGRDSNRKHSAFVSGVLHELEVLGHVRRLDDKTPIVWCKAR